MSAFFIIRQHGNTPFNTLTDLKFIEKYDTGKVVANGIVIAELYRTRWKVETALQIQKQRYLTIV